MGEMDEGMFHRNLLGVRLSKTSLRAPEQAQAPFILVIFP